MKPLIAFLVVALVVGLRAPRRPDQRGWPLLVMACMLGASYLSLRIISE